MVDDADDIRRAFASDDPAAPTPQAREQLFTRAATGARRARTTRRALAAGASLSLVAALIAAYFSLKTTTNDEPAVAATDRDVPVAPSPEAPVLREPGAEERPLARDVILAAAPDSEIRFEGGASVRTTRRSELSLVSESPPRLALSTGALRVRGTVEVEAEGCACQIRGDVWVGREAPVYDVQVTVIAGSVEAVGPRCAVRYLDYEDDGPPTDPMTEVREVRRRPTREPTAPQETVLTPVSEETPTVAPPPSADALLAERVDRFERARARIATDPRGAERELVALQREWPDAPIAAEIREAIADARAEQADP